MHRTIKARPVEFQASDENIEKNASDNRDINNQEYRGEDGSRKTTQEPRSFFMPLANVKQICNQVRSLADSVDELLDALDTVVPVVTKASTSFRKMTSYQEEKTEAKPAAPKNTENHDYNDNYYSLKDTQSYNNSFNQSFSEAYNDSNENSDSDHDANSNPEMKSASPGLSSKEDLMKLLQNPLVQNVLSNLNKKNA
ncbi:hypothetical protein SAMN00017405_2291 [Desulfonispora thiosulfatigenes DSM 11270]|uniref:Uncharacterized protein n=1 Tax=Desulfonispora thiosulfatigenes DSM 11270 TaxID=656914 RepID=A0A1W1VD79_DESTI|nr:hypothetical protein [Desulfonispora thiosulfatigenes]SMB91397.1 hypothetical protein SAMN00017405_2291 [Desulfonispora thiosulfatigenes DSM 11270]